MSFILLVFCTNPHSKFLIPACSYNNSDLDSESFLISVNNSSHFLFLFQISHGGPHRTPIYQVRVCQMIFLQFSAFINLDNSSSDLVYTISQWLCQIIAIRSDQCCVWCDRQRLPDLKSNRIQIDSIYAQKRMWAKV